VSHRAAHLPSRARAAHACLRVWCVLRADEMEVDLAKQEALEKKAAALQAMHDQLDAETGAMREYLTSAAAFRRDVRATAGSCAPTLCPAGDRDCVARVLVQCEAWLEANEGSTLDNPEAIVTGANVLSDQ
jgi:hypothetical protein